MLSAYFGFQTDPFSSTTDPAFFYAHSSVKEAVGSLLFSQMSQRRGLTLITGEAGVGKTALLSNIHEQDRAEDCSILLSCGEDWSFATLLERWSDELGVRDQVSARDAQIHAVVDYLSARSQQGNPVSTLLVDQADNLADDALEGLTEFSKIEAGGCALVHAILAARPEIAARLEQPKLQKVARGIVFRARLEPIKDSEVGDYIRHRVRAAGYEGPALYADDAIETIAEASRGVAAHINLLCHTALQLVELEQEKSVTAALAGQAIEVCTKYLNERSDAAGGETGYLAEQDRLLGDAPLVDLALKKRSRTDDGIWPIHLDLGQPETARRDLGPVPPEQAWSAMAEQSATSGGRRSGAGLWPIALLVAAALTTGAGIAWYRIPIDGIAAKGPGAGQQLAARQVATDLDSDPSRAEPPAGAQSPARPDETDAKSDEPQAAPPDSPALQTAQVLKAPSLAVSAAEGYEDQAIPLEIQLLDVDQALARRPTLILSGLPPGTILSAGRQEADGTWIVEEGDLPGLTLATPPHYSGSFRGKVAAQIGRSGGGSDLAVASLPVAVVGVADMPFLEATDTTGKEDQPVPLDLRAELADADGSERLIVQLEGLPEGAALTAGRKDSAGIWTLPGDKLGGVQLIPPKDFSGNLQITTRATALERANRDEASAMAALTVTVLGVADPPILEIEDARGLEDRPLAFEIRASLADSDKSEELEILLSGLPEGAKLSGGELLGDGSWRVDAAQFSGLTLVPPENFSGVFPVTAEAISRERDTGDRAVTTEKRTIAILGVADTPKLTARAASGREDTPIPLEITATLVDRDGSEDLVVMLSATPEGARFSAGADDGGAWILRPEQLPGLRLYPPADFSGTVEVTIDAIAREKDSDSRAKASSKLEVAVAEVADPPYLAVRDAEGQAEQPIPLHVKARLSDLDGSEQLSVSLAGLPGGARLSAGEPRPEGDWVLTAEQLPGLNLLPPARFDGSFRVTAQATAREAGGDKASLSAPFQVSIAAAPETVEVLEESAAEKLEAIYLPAPDLGQSNVAAAPGVTESGLPTPKAKPPKEQLESQAEARLTKRGNEFLALGDVVSARLFYELALDQGERDAATAIAKTFDPLFLAELGVRQSLGDKAKAVEWYRRAADGGDSEAILRLKRLSATPE